MLYRVLYTCYFLILSEDVRKVFRFMGDSNTGDDYCGDANALVLSAVFAGFFF